MSRTISFFLLIFLAPLFILLSLLILLDDGYPFLFKQKRVGKKNKHLWIYKFRTMKKGTPNVATNVITKENALFTKTGPLLRKLSLDELPQILNILIGDMKFIGPRPALYNQYELIELRKNENLSSFYPGITGWAQVNGRDLLTDVEKVESEKYYKENKSLFLDIKILYLTMFKVLLSENISKPSR